MAEPKITPPSNSGPNGPNGSNGSKGAETLRDLVESAPDFVWRVAPDLRLVYSNRAVTSLLGYDRAEIVGQPVTDWFAPDSADSLRAQIEQRFAGAVPYDTFEFAAVHKAGHIVWLNTRSRIATDNNGRPVLDCVSRDVTDRRSVEAQLRESEERYRQLVEASPDAIILHSGGRVRFANRAAARQFRAERPSDLIGINVIDFVHPDFREVVLARIHALTVRQQAVDPLRERLRRLDGSEFMAEVNAAPVMFGGVPAAQLVVRDVSERERDADRLRESETRLQALTADLAARVRELACLYEIGVAASRNMPRAALWQLVADQLRHALGEPSGARAVIVIDTDETASPTEPVPYVGRPETARASVQVGAVDRGSVELEWPGALVGLGANRTDVQRLVDSVAAQLSQVLERAELAAEVRKKEQLATLGSFTRVLAHELRNPLSAMSLAVGMLGRRAARLEASVAAEMDAIIAMLQADIARLDSMVEDYLAFGTGHLLHKGHFEVDALLSSVGARWGEECERAGVTLTVDPAAGVTLQADARKLEQVLVNLIKNAIEAMPTGGAIALRSRFVEGAFVEIDVSDTGQGMPDTERIFEPFFTTKSKGTGLGLPIVREIVRMHGGRVNVASTPGKGTTMTLRIPYAPRE